MQVKKLPSDATDSSSSKEKLAAETKSETLVVKLPNPPSHDPDKDDSVAGDDVTKTKNKKPKNGIKKVFQKLKEKVSSSLPS